MRHAPNPESVAKEMLHASGYKTFDDLFVDIPEEIREICLLPETYGASEFTARRQLEELALDVASSADSPVFIGAGCYDHYIPISVERLVGCEEFFAVDSSRGSEISQGLLQAIFEYQTVVCRLTGMEVANVSLYCGGSALAQACLIAAERTKRRLILLPETLNPDYAQIVKTYSISDLFEPRVIPEKGGLVDLETLKETLESEGENVAAVVIQYPNFYGNLERVSQIVAATKGVGALAIMSVDPIALAMLKSPGEWGADVAVGDCQAFGNAMSFGGARLGFIATSKSLARQTFGRLVGETVDENGSRRFFLTSQTRDRRDYEGTNSRLCFDEASRALTALAYLAFVGPQGLKQAANASHRIAQYARNELKKAGFKFRHDAPFLREFAVEVDDPHGMNLYLLEWGIIGGFELKDGLLLAFTEKRKREEVDELVYFMKAYQFEGARTKKRTQVEEDEFDDFDEQAVDRKEDEQ